ncbi:hypothetical protein M2352_004021 [Azospirillum fermentarium]|uniref:hypothetical protein n=1 Tax=Azospirillum fermentarium TaxID=1233114 RepID=UPI00222688CF|nr:hypothetical protein [Azospirillum fermentarium]MCW2248387.1 hypothetical protein [Azospirillum fermentarium]
MDITFNPAGETITASNGDVLTAGPGTDVLNLTGGGVTINHGWVYTPTSGAVGIESVFGSSGEDAVTLLFTSAGRVSAGTGVNGVTTVFQGVETITGTPYTSGGTGPVTEAVQLGGPAGSTVTVLNPYIIYGGTGTDAVTLGRTTDEGPSSVLMAGVEVVNALPNGTTLILGNAGNTVQVSAGQAAIAGGTGTDVVTLAHDTGLAAEQVMTVWGIETLFGSAARETVVLAAASTLTIGAIDALQGSTETDVVTLGGMGSTLFTNRMETLIGGTGTDVVTLTSIGDESGSVIAVSGLETLYGSAGSDSVSLRGSFSWMTVYDVEALWGGAGLEWVDLAGTGSTITVSGVDVLTGGVNTDVVTLDTNSTLFFSGIETLSGSDSDDSVRLGAGTVSFNGRLGADTLHLVTGNGRDEVLYNGSEQGGGLGQSYGYDTINGFAGGEDLVVVFGGLFNGLDRDHNGVMGKRAADTNGITPGGGIELFHLGTPIAALADAELASVRRAIGTTQGGSQDPFLLLATDGTNTGLYQVQDSGGDGNITAADVRLLGVFANTLLNGNDLTFRS